MLLFQPRSINVSVLAMCNLMAVTLTWALPAPVVAGHASRYACLGEDSNSCILRYIRCIGNTAVRAAASGPALLR